MAKGAQGWNSSQNAQNKMHNKIDKNFNNRKHKSKKDLFKDIVESHKENEKEKNFFEIYDSFSSWEKEVSDYMGISYKHQIMEMWEYCEDIPKIPGAPRNWIKENIYLKKIHPKYASRIIREKLYKG